MLINNSPIISVILPCYNSELHIGKAIKSILRQTFTNFELLIVDDGSSDNTISVIESFSDIRIKLFKTEHEGIVAKLNLGIKNARGSMIARMDSDDISLETRFDKQYEFLKNNKSCQIVGTNICFIDGNDNKIYYKKYPEKHENIEFQMPIYSAFCHPSILTYKSVLINAGGYEVEFESAEDHSLFLKMLQMGYQMYNIQEPLLYYRIHSNSITSIKNELQNTLSYKLGYTYITEKYKGSSKNIEKFEFQYKLGILEYYRGKIYLARQYFFKALLLYPFKLPLILRYFLPSLLGDKILGFLRKNKITYYINYLLNHFLRSDLQKILK